MTHLRSHTGSNARGFTLVEILIVVTLVVLLASVAMPTYQNTVRRTREATLRTDLFHLRDAIDQYYADKNKYPQALQDLVTDGYIREVPKDPITDSAETWVTVPAEMNPLDPGTTEPGIYNVKSGSEEISADGTPYADWD